MNELIRHIMSAHAAHC